MPNSSEVLDHFTGQVANAAADDDQRLLGSKDLSRNIFQFFLNSAGGCGGLFASSASQVLTLNVLRRPMELPVSGICEDAHCVIIALISCSGSDAILYLTRA